MAVINGKEDKSANGMTISDYLKRENIRVQTVAIECNLEIIPKRLFDEKVIENSDKIEVVSFVGGG